MINKELENKILQLIKDNKEDEAISLKIEYCEKELVIKNKTKLAAELINDSMLERKAIKEIVNLEAEILKLKAKIK